MAKAEQSILSRSRIALFVALVVGSCSTAPPGPPRAQDDICEIFAERPQWRDATLASAIRWGAPVETQMAIMWRESSFRASARPPKRYALGIIPRGRASSALGYAQAIDGTWDWYRQETGNRGADREDFTDAADFVGWYMAKTRTSNGIPMEDVFHQYLNYHQGHRGYRSEAWREEPWLMRAANQVAVQSRRYGEQLADCPA